MKKRLDSLGNDSGKNDDEFYYFLCSFLCLISCRSRNVNQPINGMIQVTNAVASLCVLGAPRLQIPSTTQAQDSPQKGTTPVPVRSTRVRRSLPLFHSANAGRERDGKGQPGLRTAAARVLHVRQRLLPLHGDQQRDGQAAERADGPNVAAVRGHHRQPGLLHDERHESAVHDALRLPPQQPDESGHVGVPQPPGDAGRGRGSRLRRPEPHGQCRQQYEHEVWRGCGRELAPPGAVCLSWPVYARLNGGILVLFEWLIDLPRIWRVKRLFLWLLLLHFYQPEFWRHWRRRGTFFLLPLFVGWSAAGTTFNYFNILKVDRVPAWARKSHVHLPSATPSRGLFFFFHFAGRGKFFLSLVFFLSWRTNEKYSDEHFLSLPGHAFCLEFEQTSFCQCFLLFSANSVKIPHQNWV